MIFKDRKDAGKRLAEKLIAHKENPDAIILALPRGGAVIAFEIAGALNLPLDILAPRKISAPGIPEMAIGAIAEDGAGIFDEQMIRDYKIPKEYIDQEIINQKNESIRRLKTYRGNLPPLDLKNKTAIIADDGVATGATMLAAIQSAKAKGAERIIAAIPTAARSSLEKIKSAGAEVVCLDVPEIFFAIGGFYEEFPQITDEEVMDLLSRSRK